MTLQKYCDLVMKGGITSGIVYPNAVLALARTFRFKNIGGTSAGAIAAAVTAAAALGDRRQQVADAAAGAGTCGFRGMEQVARQLASQGFISSLFQPASGARNAYRVIVTLAGPAGVPRKVLSVVCGAVLIAPFEFLGILAVWLGVGYVVGAATGMLAALLPALLCAYMGAGFFAALRVARVARGNLLGLCSGRATGNTPALTDWLHTVLQELSGKPLDAPLTFCDLHEAPRYAGEPLSARAINLQVITTSVSHREPRTLPFAHAHFWFQREEFDALFPKVVVDWLVQRAGTPVHDEGRAYYRLPPGEHLPVLVATRMSLSFPLLISAVPLHEPRGPVRAPQHTVQAPEHDVSASTEGLTTGGEAESLHACSFQRCWFTDGGVASNFPIHLFDEPLPKWPTFAINLAYPKDDRPPAVDEATRIEESIFIAAENNQGWQRSWNGFGKRIAALELAGFLFAIIATMQNWRDLLLSRAPGQRDRIVHIALDGDEGGMNLDMPQEILSRLAAKGEAAGERLQAQFDFRNHYWIRWRNLASAYQRSVLKVAEATHPEYQVEAYADVYRLARDPAVVPPSYPFTSQDKRQQAAALLELLIEQGAQWEDLGPDLTAGAPRPLPQLKLSPIY